MECLKRSGLENIEHHPAIDEGDRHKLYSSIHMSPNTPEGLLNKVQFDICLSTRYTDYRNVLNTANIRKTVHNIDMRGGTSSLFVYIFTGNC